MSEYQYYEFCSLGSPLSAKAREEMRSLSSRAQVTTHGASYVYNYGDFCGEPKELVLQYFDVFFYISNWGAVELIFKYDSKDIDYKDLKKYCIKDVIRCEQRDNNVLLEIDVNNEDGFGWTEGEGILPELLPLYDEIKNKDYKLLQLISAINDEFTGEHPDAISEAITKNKLLSPAQKILLETVGITYKKT